jgi:histidine triad (HIT) family protein
MAFCYTVPTTYLLAGQIRTGSEWKRRRLEETMTVAAATSCVFCRILRGDLTPGVVAFRDGQTAVFPSRGQQPRNRGHMLVVPIRHVAQIYDVDSALAGPLMTTLARVAAAVKTVWSSDGVSIRQNNDQHGGQDVFHVHFHVIPRFAGDGFTGLDRAAGMVEVTVDERIEQAKRLSDALASATLTSAR